MNVTVALFDRWKAAKNVESDRAALRLLGLSSGAAVHWRKGREAGADVLERLALDLGEEPGVHIAAAMVNQTQGDAARTWKRLARRLGAAASLAVAALLPYSEASASALGAQAERVVVGCIMRNVLAFIRSMFRSRHGPAPVLA